MRKLFFFPILFFATSLTVSSQLVGTKTIGVDYPTIAAAVTALNNQGVAVPGVIINVPAGYTETVPSGGIVLGSNILNPTTVFPSPGYNKGVRFQKSGTGANPVLMAFTGGSSTSTDGIFKIQGTDNVKIDGIDLVENPANTGNALMEWGYAFVNLNPGGSIDGCRRDTIMNCKITLNRLNPNGSYGIFSKHITANNASTVLTGNVLADFHTDFHLFNNHISNVRSGIYLDGVAGPGSAPGGSGAGSGGHFIGVQGGNRIENFGGNPGFPGYGIWEQSNGGSTIQNNKIDNMAGGGVAHGNGELIGIKYISDAYLSGIDRNSIRLTTAGNSFVTAGIYTQGGVFASQDTIDFIDGGDSGPHYGFYSRTYSVIPQTVYQTVVTNSVFKATQTTPGSSPYYFAYHLGLMTPPNLHFLDNKFIDINLNTSGTVACIYNATAADNINWFGNTIRNFRNAGPGQNFIGFYPGPSNGNRSIIFNTIDSVLFTNPLFTGNIYGLLVRENAVQSLVRNNEFSKFYTPSTGSIFGMVDSSNATTKEIRGNTISQFYTSPGGTGGASMTGISVAGNSNSLQMFENKISFLKNTGTNAALPANIKGYVLSGGTLNEVYKNMLLDLSTNSTAGSVTGLQINGGAENNIYNNLLGGLFAPFSNITGDIIRGVDFQNTNANSFSRLYYNTINVNAGSSGANFGATGVFHTASTIATTANLSMRNNIIYNNSVAKGTGIVAAFRRSSGTVGMLANYNTNSNNNLFYAGNPGPSQLIYYDGTSSAQTIGDYKNGIFPAGTIAPRDNVSVTEPGVPFLNITSLDPYYLHINTTIPTVVESGAAPVTGAYSILTDFENQSRHAATPDIGADEFVGIRAVPCTGVPTGATISGTNSICNGSSSNLSLNGASGLSGIVIQWKSSTIPGGPYTNIQGANGYSYNTGAMTNPGTIYFVVTISCPNSGNSVTTSEFALAVSPVPTVNPVNSLATCNGSSLPSIVFNGNATYTWTNNNPSIGLAAGGTGNLPPFNAVNTGATPLIASISVTPSISAGTATCTGTTFVFTITVNPQPTVTISASPSTQYNIGQPVTLTATANPSGGVFAWYKNGILVPGAAGPVLSNLNINDLGSYHVTYALNGCSGVSTPVELTGPGTGIVLFTPNPNNGQFQVRFNNSPNEPVRITAFNMLGQKVYDGRFITGLTPYSTINVDLGFKATGIYIIRLHNSMGDQVFAKPILVHF